MSHFKKIGIYAKNRTSSVISAIKKLEKSLESLGCNIFFEKTSGTIFKSLVYPIPKRIATKDNIKSNLSLIHI